MRSHGDESQDPDSIPVGLPKAPSSLQPQVATVPLVVRQTECMPPQHICVKYEKEFSLVVCNAPRLVALGSAGLERSVTSGPKPS